MKNISYTINLRACDAQTVMGQKLDDETEEDYERRFKAAEGKFFMRVTIMDLDGSPQHVAIEGPYFEWEKHNPAMPILQILHVVSQVAVQRELEKAGLPKDGAAAH